ncbi:hypothetical protein [Aliiglaciecola lipolytica]|uniref:Stress-induced protein UspE n=1 Tax=Aliiglaciecola lipolytica E3 TaxID=1127673 RepID=K6YDP0_9ALTE|nr:hypothetical protein [Aliiglaciecola lipolytica]GAC14763.1 hypothetical protein GLIP_2135 [Aliiglaciecola lipolytica E3]
MLKPIKKPYSDLIQKNLAGEYNFDLKVILAKGFENTTSSIWIFFQMIFVVFGISLVIATIYIKFQGIQTMEQFTQSHLMTLDLVIQLVIAPFTAAMMLQGANSHIKRLANVRFLFSTLPQALPICVVTGFILLLTKIGMTLFILPGLYLMIATSFAVLLVADKRLTPIDAIILSVKMVNRYLFPFTILYFLFLILLILSIVSFGIGLLLLIPFYYNVNGMLYSELFGYGSADETLQPDSAGDSTFDA